MLTVISMKQLSVAYFFFCLASCVVLLVSISKAQTDYTTYVDPFIGTGEHGHTYPGATVPFAMVQLSPDTRIDGSWDGCSGYHYSDSIIYGFSHTHLNGTGCSDYGDIMLMPMTGEPSLDNKVYSSKFSHRDEAASAGYYSVKLDNHILVELTSTARVGMHRYTFPESGKANVILDLTHRDKLIQGTVHRVNSTTFEGLRRSEAWAKDQWVFYRIEFSKPAMNSLIVKKGDNDEKVLFEFKLDKNEKLLVKVALSSVSEEGARKNMAAELPHWDFEKIKKEARDAWQKELNKIEVKGGTQERMKVFYTALYHTMIQPNIYNDVDGQYRGRDLKIHHAEGFNYYTVFSLWDTFRAWHPLMTIIDRKRTLDYIKTFLVQYEQGGLLPVWELSSNETECMIGYHAVSVIADATVKGITDFNLEEAFEAMKKSAMTGDRYGLGAYMEDGFLSMEVENESVSKTLEYAYDDFCIAQMAQLLHHEKDYRYFMERSQSWKNLFDPETKFIRPRKNGGWYEPFDPREVNNNYTEANAWQYTFFVPQEIEELERKMGGPDGFEKKLDELFTTDSKTSGREQSDITGLIGQYAHGNEPSHHMAFLYAHTWNSWKTQKFIRRILKDFYHASPDGLIGNEDCGQMSAWFILASLGFYQVCPGVPEYTLFAPSFPEIKINFENGKSFLIQAEKCSDENLFANSFIINGIQSDLPFIKHSDIVNGNKLVFEMGKKSDKDEAVIKASSNNGSVLTDPITNVPLIQSPTNVFKDKTSITITATQPDVTIYYTLNNSTPNLQSSVFNPQFPIPVDSTKTVKAIAVNKKGEASKVSTAHFYKMPHPLWKINLLSDYSHQYTAGGDEGLIDGIQGDVNWRKGNWQGYLTDLECVIDFGKDEDISQFSADFLQDSRAWILFPKQVEFSFSTDSIHFSNPKVVMNGIEAKDYTVQIQQFAATIPKQKVRYLKVKAINFGILPEWHAGSGRQAWIFADEISAQ